MTIESVEAFPVRVKMKDRLLAGTFRYEDYQSVLVKTVWNGVPGWGEAMTRFSAEATAGLVRWVGHHLEGRDFPRPEAAWEDVYRQFRVRGQTRGIAMEALSGVEMSLWDAWGRTEGKSIAKLLSARSSASVPAYAGSIFESRGPIAEQIEWIKSLGLKGVKLKVGFGVATDTRLLAQARRRWGDGMMVADANGAYDTKSASKAMEKFERFRLAWLEEPVPSDDFDGYAAIAKGRKVKVGAGETWYAGDFARPISGGLVDVVEPSVSRCGGIACEARVAREASKRGIDFSPMVGANSALSLAASLQVAAALGSIGVEYDAFDNPLVQQLAPGFPELSAGKIAVPSGPGLGVEVDPKFIKANLLG